MRFLRIDFPRLDFAPLWFHLIQTSQLASEETVVVVLYQQKYSIVYDRPTVEK